MMKPMRELTPKEIRSIRKLVTTKCANYDKEYGCLPLDCECPMLNICYTHSAMCSYFRESVLPNDPGLSAAFQPLPTKRCKHCADAASRKRTAARVRKHRKKKADM